MTSSEINNVEGQRVSQAATAPPRPILNGHHTHDTQRKRLYPFADLEDPSATEPKHHHPSVSVEPVCLDALIVGASWAGIYALHRLRSSPLSLNVKLIDACSDVGGVWHYTRYPGCRVDTEIPFYEFSKPEHLWQKWSWTERFPSRAEVQRYLGFVCDELGLRGDIVQETRVGSCVWDEVKRKWMVRSADGAFAASTRFLLPCAGYSTIRYIPDFPGIEQFEQKFHTSNWPEDLEYRGKKIAVIGTAASGLQVIENVAKECGHLTVFQRTPNLATPMRQRRFSQAEMAEVKKEYPSKFAARRSAHGFDGKIKKPSSADSPKQREQTFERLWERGGLAFWFGNYEDALRDPVTNARIYNFWRRKVRQRIKDPVKAEILAPIKPPHAFGTKRPSLETAYFEVFNQPNVHLVDLHSDPIVAIHPTGIETASGSFHEADILALATGFDFLTGSMLAMGIRGRNGQKLNDRWHLDPDSEGLGTYLGLMTEGFPNMFFPMGPQAPSALGLTPQMAEIQGDWIGDLVKWMTAQGHGVVEPSLHAQEKWKREVDGAAKETLFGTAESWYMGVNIPGRKKQPLCYFGGVNKYMSKLEESTANEYPGLRFR